MLEADEEGHNNGAAPPTHLAYYPSLDGLRGVALIAILFYHSGVNWLPGGFLSVSTFFTLSGFLITSLLLYERENTGRNDLARFWSRRFRRLMPGALLAFFVIALLGNTIGDASQLSRLRWDGLSALFYVSNWRFIYLGNDYADLFASPSLVQHFWSLSIEEQFYLGFPLVVVAVFFWGGRRALTWVLGGLTAFSTVWMAMLFEPDLPTSRLYFGTDTRLAEILLGALLALWHAGRPPLAGRGQRTAIAIGGVGLVGTLVFWFAVSERTHWLWQGGFSLYALITCAAILGAIQPTGPALRLLGWGPFPWLGKVSYGVYLYHFPVYVTLTPELMGLERWPLFVVRIAVTFAFATTSYYLLEMPIRQKRLVTGWRPWLVLPASVALASLSLVLATIDPPAQAVDLRELPKAERLVEGGGPRILVVGGSVSLGIGKSLQRWARKTGGASVYNLATRGCGIARGGRLEDVFKRFGDECDSWPSDWAKSLDDFDPDIAVVLTGGWDIREREFPNWGRALLIGDPVYDEWLLGEFNLAIDLLSSRGARVAWLTTPCYAEVGRGTAVWDPERVYKLNTLLDQMVEERNGDFELIDLFEHVCPNGVFVKTLGGIPNFRPDGAHFSDAGADWVVEWLAPHLLTVQPREGDPPAPDFILLGDSLCKNTHWAESVFGGRAKNLCVDGTTSGWWLSERDRWLPYIAPDRQWIILVGANDAGLGVTYDYPASLSAIVEELVEAGQRVRIIHTPHVRPPERPSDPSLSENLERSVAVVNADLDFEREADLVLCARYSEVDCGPDLIRLLDRSEHFSDGVHFSILGDQVVAEAVARSVLSE